jgi:hypothetical protein
VAIAIAAAALVEASGATGDVVRSLRSLGVPTSGQQWRQIGTVAGIASLAGMLLGSVLGGILGERWHTKLMARALDPGVGPEATLREAQVKALRAEERRHEIIVTDDCLTGVEEENEKALAGAGTPAKPKTSSRSTKNGRGSTRAPRRSAKRSTGRETGPEKKGPDS